MGSSGFRCGTRVGRCVVVRLQAEFRLKAGLRGAFTTLHPKPEEPQTCSIRPEPTVVKSNGRILSLLTLLQESARLLAWIGNRQMRETIAVTPASSMPLDFSIRLATNDDIPAIKAILFAVRSEYGVLGEIGANDADLHDIEQNYFRVGGCFRGCGRRCRADRRLRGTLSPESMPRGTAKCTWRNPHAGAAWEMPARIPAESGP